MTEVVSGISVFWVFAWLVGAPMAALAFDLMRTSAALQRRR